MKILNVIYNKGINSVFDEAVREKIGNSVSAGCCCFGDFQRDMQFEFKTKKQAEQAMEVVERIAYEHNADPKTYVPIEGLEISID